LTGKLRAKEAAAYLGVCRRTFYKHVRPTIPAIRIGSRVSFDTADLDAFTASRKEAVAEPPAEAPVARSFQPPAPVRSREKATAAPATGRTTRDHLRQLREQGKGK
jgi:excisionase family DNA binding protein